jgi:hypothetical protein
MSDGEAEANTSAGAPDTIWVASAPDEPKLKAIEVPGWTWWKLEASWVNVPVRDDAADTVMDPDSGAPVVDVVVDVVAVEDEDEHAAAIIARTATAAMAQLRPAGRLTG